MRLSDFDFELPERNIALRPAEPRDSARMLVVDPRAQPDLVDACVRDLLKHLRPGDTMVFNDTRVVPARLFGIRRRGGITAKVEILLHRREAPDRWTVFAKPGKRLAIGDSIVFGDGALDAMVLGKSDSGDVLLAFNNAGHELDAAVMACGILPLPPYIASKRSVDDRDMTDYQTVYAQKNGAVAAPTAGLHFTEDLLDEIDAMGVKRCFVTLHVGAGTFLPVKSEIIAEHRMHSEFGIVADDTAALLNDTRRRGGRIIAVGTTSLRLLESAAADDGTIHPISASTAIFITPGYRFKAVDGLMTNFHLPKSTLFMLVCAFAGAERMRRAYAHAIASGYRFYSYGDSSLLFRAP